MKICQQCGNSVADEVRFCSTCGSAVFEPATEGTLNAQPVTASEAPAPVSGNGNVLAGVVGAFLFSLIGAALYFVLYQINIIAGISGLVMFVLANFGYGLFAGTKNKVCVAGIVSAVIAMLVMLFVAEYISLSYEIYQVYSEQVSITFFDAVAATPQFLEDPDVSSAVIGDLLFAYLFGALAAGGNIVSLVKGKR